MDDQRKKIIVNEINYWKQNRMLPEHYCDFLLNLYTEGITEAEPASKKIQFELPRILTVFLLGLLSLSVLLFYFTELSLILQMTIIILFGISSLISGIYLISNSYLKLIPLLATALILLIITIQAAEISFPDNTYILYFVTIANCLLWVIAGVKWKMISFKISGIAGIIILFITIFI
ncbi:hypothetical protein AABM38_16780 [Heyndrickxia sp. MSNUG]|uniref:hypothetical protein n=1 Tax=Heyndrickxia sp. MSNUG TaxID=3136677 RepID=UPI003C2DD70B